MTRATMEVLWYTIFWQFCFVNDGVTQSQNGRNFVILVVCTVCIFVYTEAMGWLIGLYFQYTNKTVFASEGNSRTPHYVKSLRSQGTNNNGCCTSTSLCLLHPPHSPHPPRRRDHHLKKLVRGVLGCVFSRVTRYLLPRVFVRFCEKYGDTSSAVRSRIPSKLTFLQAACDTSIVCATGCLYWRSVPRGFYGLVRFLCSMYWVFHV